MLEHIASLPGTVIGLRASGRVSAADYAGLDAALAGIDPDAPLRLLLEIAPDFRRFATTLLWEHPRCGLYRLRRGDRLALVADHAWLRDLARHARPAAGELRGFAGSERDAAIDWLTRT